MALQSIIEKEESLLKNIETNSILNPKIDKIEHYQMARLIITKLIEIQKNFIQDKNNLLLGYTTLRHHFEILVTIKLLLKEEKYTYSLFYSNLPEQIDSLKKLIKRLKSEIELIEEYKTRYLDLFKPENDKELINEQEKELYKISEKEITAFWGDYKVNGFGYQSLIMKQLLNKYIDLKENLQREKNEIFNELNQRENIKLLFNISNNKRLTVNNLKDKRSWSQKSKTTEMMSEYNQTYNLTSSLMHNTSFSLFTELKLNQGDTQYINELIINYSDKIIQAVNEYLTLYDLSSIKVFKLE